MLAAGPAVSFNLTVDVRPRHTFISENVAAHTGYSASAFLSSDTLWASLIHPDDRASVADSLGFALADGSATQDYRIRHADGTYRRVHGQVRVTFDDAGVPNEFVGWWMEVTALPNRGDVEQSLPPARLHAHR
jgi:PAS domain-containing protein